MCAPLVQATGAVSTPCPGSRTPGSRAAEGRSPGRGNRPSAEIILPAERPQRVASLTPEEQTASIFPCVPLKLTNISQGSLGARLVPEAARPTSVACLPFSGKLT